jgi:aspartate racemase
MRTIGLVGGMTPESTLTYYGLLIRSARDRLQDPDPLRNPIVIVYSLDLAEVVALQRARRTDELAADLARICELLRATGAEIGALTANTPHLYFEAVQASTRLELVSIVEATCATVANNGLRRPLLLGTRSTMESTLYRAPLERAGIEALIPDGEGVALVDEAIYNDLAVGRVRPDTRARMLGLCREAVERRGADGVILGCTELPLVIAAEDLPVPVVDTVRVHVEAILDRALASV